MGPSSLGGKSSVQPAHQGPFRIDKVARLTKVPAATLRAWERRYGIPAPARTESDYRLYNTRDVNMIRAMRRLCERGMSPAEAARSVLQAAAQSDRARHSVQTDVFAIAVGQILQTVERYDGDALERELMRAFYLSDPSTTIERVVTPVLTQIGDQWCHGSCSIAQEHLASERIERVLRAQLRWLERPEVTHTVLLGCFAEEEHVLALLCAAIHFAHQGIRPILLGARTPPSAIADAVGVLRPSLVGLSATVGLPGLGPFGARELVDAYADALRTTPWVVGGLASGQFAEQVEAAGGMVARGSPIEWGKEVRARVSAAAHRVKRNRSKGHKVIRSIAL